MLTVKEIVDALHAYYEARDWAKESRQELIQICVDLGQDQGIAMKSNPADFLDGYLFAKGHKPKESGHGDQ